MLPGVLLDPLTVSQGTEDEVVNVRICETTLEATVIALGRGGALAPGARENDADAEERIRSGVFASIVMLALRFEVAGIAEESVTTTVKPKLPTAPGVPPIWPCDSASPAMPKPPELIAGRAFGCCDP